MGALGGRQSGPVDLAESIRPRVLARIARVLVGVRGTTVDDGDALERRLYVLRRVIERRALELGLARSRFHLASLSSRTLIYKGMLTAAQLERFYPDLSEQDMVSSLALVRLLQRQRVLA